jgi:hypothetical protein
LVLPAPLLLTGSIGGPALIISLPMFQLTARIPGGRERASRIDRELRPAHPLLTGEACDSCQLNDIVAHVLGDHSSLQWRGNSLIASKDHIISVDSGERSGRDGCWRQERRSGPERERLNLKYAVRAAVDDNVSYARSSAQRLFRECAHRLPLDAPPIVPACRRPLGCAFRIRFA